MLILVSACAVAEPVVLDNGAIRVEVLPELFSVVFVGFPGGHNFVEPVHLESSIVKGTEWADPGGIVTDLIPYPGRDVAIRRGPAKIVEREEQRLVMEGPVSNALGVRLRKEIRLVDDVAQAFYKVYAIFEKDASKPWALRNTVRVPRQSTLRIHKKEAEIRLLSGTESLAPAVVKSMRYWQIPIPPTSTLGTTILGAFAPKMEQVMEEGVWTRYIALMPEDAKTTPHEVTFLCLLDDVTQSYGSALQGEEQKMKAGETLLFCEEWHLRKHCE